MQYQFSSNSTEEGVILLNGKQIDDFKKSNMRHLRGYVSGKKWGGQIQRGATPQELVEKIKMFN